VAGGSLYSYVHARSIAESSGGTTSYGAMVTIDSAGAVLLYSRINGTGANRVATGVTVTAADRLNIRVKASGASPTRLQAKTWKAGTAEPSGWAIDLTDSTSGLQTAGGIALGNFTSGAATNAPITVAWDDLAVSDGVTANLLPNVAAGADQTATAGQTVTLTGTASDPDGTIASRAWTCTGFPSGGSAPTLAGAGTANASFTAPSTPGAYTFQFTATDNGGGSATDVTTVTVKALTTPPNVNATLSTGLVAIDATSSTGANPLTFSCSPAPFAEPEDGYFEVLQTTAAQVFRITATDTVTGAAASTNVTVPALSAVGTYDGAPVVLQLPVPLDPASKDVWADLVNTAFQQLRDAGNDLIGHYNGDSSASPTPATTPSTPSPAATTAKLTRAGANLQVNGSNRRLSGANAYWLGLNDNAGTSAGSFPSKTSITAAVQGMREMGVNLVRAHTVGISTGTPNSFEPSVGVFSDANLDAADWAVWQAKQAGIYLMVPLTDNWNYYHGGKWNFVHWAYQQNPSGITDTPGTSKDDVNERIFFANSTAGLRVRALFKDYISHWLNHVNPYTGLAYKDDPTIAIIETGNEIYYAAQTGSNEWTQDIASYVKSIAPDKLIADGSAADRVAVSTQPGLTAAAVDIVGAHYYPQQQSGYYPPVTFGAAGAGYPAGTALQQLVADATTAANAGKPFIVGEYPWTRSDVATWYSTIESTAAIDGDMFWSMVAGTEVHGGTFGSDDYPVHRPYLGSNETANAPALAQHISSMTGLTRSNGA